MPTREEIEKFKSELTALGHEPSVRASRGEKVLDIPIPEEGLPEDLAELLGGISEDTEAADFVPEEKEPQDGFDAVPEDWLDLSGSEEALDITENGEPEGFEGPAEFADIPEGPETDDFSDFPEIPETDDFAGTIEAPAGEESPDIPETPEEIPEAEDFDFGGLGDIGGDIDFDAEPESEPDETMVPALEPSEFDELGSFGSDEEAEEFSEEIPEEIPEEEIGEAEEVIEDFDIPELAGESEDAFDLSDLSGSEEDGLSAVEDISFDDLPEAIEGPSEDETEAESEEDFSFPDLSAEPEDEGQKGEIEEETEEIEEFTLPEGLVFEKGGEEQVEEFTVPEGDDSMGLPGGAPDEIESGFGLPDTFEGDASVDVDEFNLGDFSDQFGLLLDVKEGAPPPEEELNPANVVTGELPEQELDLVLSDEDFKALKATLGLMPRNLRLAIEELIGEKYLGGPNLKKLIDLLIQGAPPRELAALVGRITGKRIKIPLQYEKKTGLEFEEEKKSFGYVFRKNILPILKVVVLGLVALGFLSFFGYRFVYRPLRAVSLYRQGHKEITQDRFDRGNEYFDRAVNTQIFWRWFYKYADTFREKRQYFLVQEKYEQILTLDAPRRKKRKPEFTKPTENYQKVHFVYGEFEYSVMKNYEKAETLLLKYLDFKPGNYEGLITLGDMYMEWAEEDRAKYEEARYSYALLIEKYGRKPELLFRMLKYFIRLDKETEVLRLKEYFDTSPKIKVDPAAYAELGGYLIDKRMLEDVRAVLFRAQSQSETLPDIYYQFARFFHITKDQADEEAALKLAVNLFQNKAPLTVREMGMLIDSHNRLGKNYYLRQRYIDAEEEFTQGIELYRDSVRGKFIGRSEKYGSLFSNLADIHYYISGDLRTALALYREARQNLYSPPELTYKIGYILYRDRDYDSALMEFYRAAGGFSSNRNLLFATANTLYLRDSHFSAQGYYNMVLDSLEKELSVTQYILLDERPDHYALIENLMKTYNNLGVTLFALSAKSEEAGKFGEALYYLTKSSEFYDRLSRDPETLERSETINLAFLNTRALLYPLADNTPAIFPDIPRDMEDLFFR